MALFAGDRGIMTGEELTYDYNFDPYCADKVQTCMCGESGCRGVLGPKTKEEKERERREKTGRAPVSKGEGDEGGKEEGRLKGVKRKIVEVVEEKLDKKRKVAVKELTSVKKGGRSPSKTTKQTNAKSPKRATPSRAPSKSVSPKKRAVSGSVRVAKKQTNSVRRATPASASKSGVVRRPSKLKSLLERAGSKRSTTSTKKDRVVSGASDELLLAETKKSPRRSISSRDVPTRTSSLRSKIGGFGRG
jgi:[histone H3]-lysine4 N-trimethyltransferase ASH1L